MMLINKMGVESEDEIVDLESRRVAPNPKNRETMTMLLQSAMTAVPRSQLRGKPVPPDATVSSLEAEASPVAESTHTDVA